MSPDQLKYFILLEEIKILKTKIQQLEEENEEMTSSLIKHLQG
jgi:cell shape-determining protein MreC